MEPCHDPDHANASALSRAGRDARYGAGNVTRSEYEEENSGWCYSFAMNQGTREIVSDATTGGIVENRSNVLASRTEQAG